MLETLTSVVVVALAIVPGLPAETIYRMIVGSDWREEFWQRVIRTTAFSVFGLALYALFAGALTGLPSPGYIDPDNWTDIDVVARLPSWGTAYLLHAVSTSALGFGFGFAIRGLNRWGPLASYPDAWDEFVRSHAPEHWVVVEMKSGAVFAGYLKKADISVRDDERDIVLAEPLAYEPETGKYVATEYVYAFLPGTLISSIAVKSETTDERLTEIHSTVLEPDDEQEQNNVENPDDER